MDIHSDAVFKGLIYGYLRLIYGFWGRVLEQVAFFFALFKAGLGNLKSDTSGPLWWLSGNQPANAGAMGSVSSPGRSHMLWSNSAHAPQLLSLCSRARTQQLLSPWAATTEAREPRACAPQPEEALQIEA